MSLTQFDNKTVLITGGTGSFGRRLAQRLLTESNCKKVIIFSRDEWKQWEMRQADPIFNHPNIRYFLGDVRDKDRLERAFNEVNYIVHAAALKQVPAAEYNPTEFIKTNVLGAMNIIDAAIKAEVEKVIALSTDKAVNPINLYGASKLCSDKLFVAGNSYVGAKGKPKFSVVRYGNVAGTRGSIVPHWRTLLANGATSLPITDPRMTRFWITLDQAVEFVIKCFNDMKAGEIFVPKIPSIRIEELAEALAPGVSHHICGIRDGEKLHELMVSGDDARHTVECEDYYIIIPESIINSPPLLNKYLEGRQGKLVKEGFVYCSFDNQQWLDIEALRTLCAKI